MIEKYGRKYWNELYVHVYINLQSVVSDKKHSQKLVPGPL